MALELRPLGFGDRIGAAFKLYGANFATLMLIVAVIVIPLGLIGALVTEAFSPDFSVDENGIIDIDAIEADQVIGFVAVIFFVAIISALGTLLATGGVMKAVADDIIGEPGDWQDSLRYAWSKIGPLIIGSILYGLGLLGAIIGGLVVVGVLVALFDAIGGLIGGIALAVGIVFLVVSWSIWVPTVIVEDLRATDALRRSFHLVKGRRWPVFGYFLTMYILVILIAAVLGGVFGGILGVLDDPGVVANSVANIAVQVITTPISAAAVVVLYFDQRVRNEAFDVQDLAAHMRSGGDDAFGSLPPQDPPTPRTPPEDEPGLDMPPDDDPPEDPPNDGFPRPEGI